MNQIFGYVIGGLLIVVALLGGAVYWQHKENQSLAAAKAVSDEQLKRVIGINAQNAENFTQFQAQLAEANAVLEANQKATMLTQAAVDQFKDKVLTDVPETNTCADSPAMRSTFEWVRKRQAPVGGGDKAGPPAGAKRTSAVPVPASRPYGLDG